MGFLPTTATTIPVSKPISSSSAPYVNSQPIIPHAQALYSQPLATVPSRAPTPVTVPALVPIPISAPIPVPALQQAQQPPANINPNLEPAPNAPSPSSHTAGLASGSAHAWQCLNALLFCGPRAVPSDGSLVACSALDIGPYSSVAPPTQILTTAYVASLRERLLQNKLANIVAADAKQGQGRATRLGLPELQQLQRQTRAKLAEVFLRQQQRNVMASLNLCMLPEQLQNMLCSRRAHTRQKKQHSRDAKLFYKEDRRRRLEAREILKRKQQDIFKALVDHRERFFSYHRFIRNTARALALAVVDNAAIFRRRKAFGTDALADKRLSGLKGGDVDGYAALINETKNDRLKYLLEETESCVTTINKLISKQMGGKSLEAEREQEVVQPSMLRGGDLKEYQLEGLKWMVSLYENNLNGILADDMGLGKTIQTIALLSYLMENKRNNGPFLIVVPLSTLSNWANETTKWAPSIIRVVYKGPPAVRKQVVKDIIDTRQFNVLLTTYEYIMKDSKFLRKVQWEYIIVDEGHRMKNAESKFAQTLGTVYTSKHRLLLTGTPLQNNLPELWALLNFLLPTVFNSLESFDQWFNKPFAQFRLQGIMDDNVEQAVLSHEERMLIVHRLHQVMRPFMLRRVKDQVLDQLPEKREIILRCRLSGWQRKLYKAIYARSVSGVREVQTDGTIVVQGLNNPVMHMRKVCNHPYLFLNDWAIDEDLVRASGKFELLDRMLPKLAAAGHRVLMFTQMTQLMTIMERFFDMRGIKYLRLDGSTSSEERERRMYMFNDPDSPYFIFLLSTRAGGLGLNLATADTVIIFDSDWNPMIDAQAQDRAHRIGQKNEVRVFRLVAASSVEDKILARATDKKNLNGLVIEAGLVGIGTDRNQGIHSQQEEGGTGTKEMMESLLSEWSAGGVDLAEEEEDDVFVADDEQINDMMAIYDGEHELYTAIDKERAATRDAEWRELNAQQGLVRGLCPPPPALLMGKDEQPPWLTADSWAQKNSGIVQAMLGTIGRIATSSVTSGQGEGGGIENGNSSGVFDPNDGYGYDAFGNKLHAPGNIINSAVIGGKSTRQRKDVSYDDGMTEGQFQRLMEKHAGDAEDSRKKAKRAREEAVENGDNMEIDENSASKQLRERVMKSVGVLLAAILRLKRPNGGSLCEWFKEKPPKHIFGDYYTLIENPISMKEIVARCKRGGYSCIEYLEEDFALMSRNARTYNLDGSEVLMVCEDIRSAFYEGVEVIRAKFKLPSRSMPALIHGTVNIYDEKELAASELLLDRLTSEEDMMMEKIKFDLNKTRV